MSATLKIIQLNIERSKHLELVVAFLRAEATDVVCMQELMQRDIAMFEESLAMRCSYAPNCFHPAEDNNPGVMGIGIFSKWPTKTDVEVYNGTIDPLPVHTPGIPGTTANPLVWATIEKEGEIFIIGTTHFTVALNGGVNDLQRDHLQKMLALLTNKEEFLLTGDFNAPRGGEIFSELAAKYKDNIPLEYASSIDGSLHRAGPLPYMVDGIFSTPGYEVSEVVMKSGVSDHCAFIASVEKK